MNLWDSTSGLASLSAAGVCNVACNSATQILRGAFLHPDLRILLTVAERPHRIVASSFVCADRRPSWQTRRYSTFKFNARTTLPQR